MEADVALREHLAQVVETLAAEQGVCREHVRLQPALDRDPALRVASIPDLADLRADLLASAVESALAAGKLQAAGGVEGEAYLAPPGPSFLRSRFGDARLGWWQPVDVAETTAQRATPQSEQVARGEPVLALDDARAAIGIYEGYDWLGRPVLRRWLGQFSVCMVSEWDAVRVLRPLAWREHAPGANDARAPFVGLVPAVCRDLPQPFVLAFERLLAQDAIGGHPIGEFVDALKRAGYVVTFHGGSLREPLAMLHANADTPPDTLLAHMTDVDIVTTAPNDAVRRVIRTRVPELAALGLAKPSWVDQQGVCMFRPRGTSGQGFDTASARNASYLPRDASVARNAQAAGNVFDHHLEEDRWCIDYTINAVMAHRDPDSKRWLMLDPLGGAYDDVVQHIVRIPRDHGRRYLHQTMRYWKFRLRGYTSDQLTKDRIAALTHRDMPLSPLLAICRTLGPFAGAACQTREGTDAFFARLQAVMIADGHADLFEAYFAKPALQQRLHQYAVAHAAAARAMHDLEQVSLDEDLDGME